jgi:DNA-binding protein H-NS
MNTNYQQLLAEREALDQKINEMRNAERAGVIERIRKDVADFDLTERDVFGGAARTSVRKGITVAAKYRDPQTGATWTGRGKPPKWISDKDRQQFLIA